MKGRYDLQQLLVVPVSGLEGIADKANSVKDANARSSIIPYVLGFAIGTTGTTAAFNHYVMNDTFGTFVSSLLTIWVVGCTILYHRRHS